ncbi:hypothetical protein [Gilvimarinus algae]|uniref:Uncharacterized protein n=1 Tax=Gilvimarinus algae TaxID=3058037 RepID=A0ABT8TI52_9GAMM|nr:hypothetical protein [Gilvimarinus sp. SDUM040014]MDO3383763.1 hypothetical protein [Gilvimarinus sp. SDUM040014]
MNKKEKFPARLHVLISRDSEQAIIIRRGPSKATCILLWNRKRNTFKVSQWLKGRIYERRSDISPSGDHWIYFAMNGKWGSEAKGAWTAVARTPWLKAISLYAKGDCWNGGGLFLNDGSFWLNGDCFHEVLFTSNEVTKVDQHSPKGRYGGECPSVYYNRLQRDGWTLTDLGQKASLDSETIFEKSLDQHWVLRKICHEQVGSAKGKGCYWDEHVLNSGNGGMFSKPNWEWAEWVDGSIVYAESGCLYRVVIIDPNQFGEPKLLHDFNEYEFEDVEAPY